VWLAGDPYIVGCDLHWKVHVEEAIKLARQGHKEAEATRSKFPKPVDLMNGPQCGKVELRKAILDTELAPRLRGFPVRLFLQDEAPNIGSGQRTVLCQFRGKRVVLHDGAFTQAIKREVFKELVASNRRHRKRNAIPPARSKPTLTLAIDNPAPLPSSAAA
jgi:hypothetical protein